MPVLTTVKSTAVPVGKAPFPSVIFCSDGTPTLIILAAYTRTLVRFLKAKTNMTIYNTPYELVNMNFQNLFSQVS